MKEIRYVLFCTLVVFSFLTIAQSTGALLPVKKDGQWGFIDEHKKWVIPPIYQLCLPFEGRDYTWVKSGEYSLLIDQKGRVLEQLLLDEVVEIRGDVIIYKKRNLLGWHVRSSSQKIEATYRELTYLPNRQLFIAKDSVYTKLVTLQNRNVLPVDSITSIVADDCYTITRNGYIGILDSASKILIPPKYSAISRSSNYFVATDHSGLKHVYTSSGTLIYHGMFDDISHVSDAYFQCRKEKWYYLLNSNTGQLEDSTTGLYIHFRKGIIALKDESGMGAYSTVLHRRIIPPQYVNLYNQVGSTYIITYDGQGLFGLKDSTGTDRVDTRYNSIGSFQKNSTVCTVAKNGKYGLIGIDVPMVLPPQYSYISVGADNVVKTKQGNVVILYEFDRQQKLVDSMRFTNVGTLRMGGTITMGNIARPQSTTDQLSPFWYQGPKGKWGLRDEAGGIRIKPLYDEIVKLPNTPLVLGRIFSSRSSRLSRRISVMSSSTYGVINELTLKPVVISGLLYVDTAAISDNTVNVMRVITGGGYFGSIHTRTGRLRRYNSKYVSSFSDGIARIFIGTK